MRLVVFSHKPCWYDPHSPLNFVTDGGFPFQMMALSQLFERTRLVVPCSNSTDSSGLLPLTGHNLSVRPLTPPRGRGLARKFLLPVWFVRNIGAIIQEIWRADAVHAPIPGDIGTIGMILAFLMRKPLFVRHCGNWFLPKTVAEHFWKWFMEQFAGGKQVMLATGGASHPPSLRNAAIRWIFSTTLTENELLACLERKQFPAQETVRLIIACRQDQEKGAGVVIESLPLILKNYPHVELDIVGDGLALADFKKQAAILGVDGHITFHGKVDHKTVLNLLRRAHLFCYPTRASEGFPKIVLEALACGLPVITTRVSVLPQLIGSGSGILLEEGTPGAVAKAVTTVLANEKLYCEMSEKALETARQYSLERWRDTIGERLRTAWQL
jgi:glycosyltransferase involved in cell wall biosynthesis